MKVTPAPKTLEIQPASEPTQLARIAGGLEWLQKALERETDPARRTYIFNLLGEAMVT